MKDQKQPASRQPTSSPLSQDYQSVLDALHRTQQQQAFLLQLNDLLGSTVDPLEIQLLAARLLGEQTNADQAGYARIPSNRKVAIIEQEYRRGNASSILGEHFFTEYESTYEAYKAGRIMIINDVENDPSLPDTDRIALRALAIRSLISVPLIKDKRSVACMTVLKAIPYEWTQQDIFLVCETAERTWAALERAYAQEALRQSEAEFRTLTEAAPALVWVCSPQGENIYFNQRWYDYTGQTAQQASGQGWTAMMHPDDTARIIPYWQACQLTGQPYEGEVRYQRHDGVYRWHLFRGMPRYATSGHIESWYGLSIDIDDAKQAQQALQQVDQRKDEFLAMLAHELRNPMATICSGLQILELTSAGDANSANTIAMMSRQAGQLVQMLDDLLDVSRISQGKIVLKKQRVDVGVLLEQAAQSVQGFYHEQGRRLQLDLPAATLEVEGDPTRLNQVVINLLTNAARYTGDNGQVWLSLAKTDQQALIQVRDNGIGLSKDQLISIFDLFMQVDNSLSRSKGGLGLGLTLVKRLVEMHNGRVEVQSEGVGKGSTFRVFLPVLASAGDQATTLVKASPAPRPAMQILVVDDNVDAAMTLSMLLRLKGYEVHTRHTGQDALAAAGEWRPRVILLDIGMPTMDGYQTCRLLRQQDWGQQVFAIALSGYGQDEDKLRASEAGFDSHFTKPVDIDALTTLLATLPLSNY